MGDTRAPLQSAPSTGTRVTSLDSDNSPLTTTSVLTIGTSHSPLSCYFISSLHEGQRDCLQMELAPSA